MSRQTKRESRRPQKLQQDGPEKLKAKAAAVHKLAAATGFKSRMCRGMEKIALVNHTVCPCWESKMTLCTGLAEKKV